MKRILAAGFALVFICISSCALAVPGQNGTPGTESLNLPDDLINRVYAVLSMDGAASNEQFLARLDALGDYLRDRMDEFRRDPAGVINAALIDPTILAAGTGNVLVSAGSGGGGGRNDPCGWAITWLNQCAMGCTLTNNVSSCIGDCRLKIVPQYINCLAKRQTDCGKSFNTTSMSCCGIAVPNPKQGPPCLSVCSETVSVPGSTLTTSNGTQVLAHCFQFKRMSDWGGASLSVFVHWTKETIVVAPCVYSWPSQSQLFTYTLTGQIQTFGGKLDKPFLIDVSVDMSCRSVPAPYKDDTWSFYLDCNCTPTNP